MPTDDRTTHVRATRLYHGSNVEVAEPRILVPSRSLDFGPGFYVTSSRAQAERWSVLTCRRRRVGAATVSVFELDADDLEGLDVLEFDSASADWLRFVAQNRGGTYVGKRHDVVRGPVANDRTMPVIADFMAGNIDERTALVLLMPQRLEDQYAFLSAKALGSLRFLEAYRHGE